MLVKRPIRSSRPCAPRLSKTCGRRFLRSSPAIFAGKPPHYWMKQVAEENKRRFKESRWTIEGREEVINAKRRPLEPLNHESRLDTPRQVNELVQVSASVEKWIERPSRPPSSETMRQEVKEFTEECYEGRDDQSRESQEIRKEKIEQTPERRQTRTFSNGNSNQQEEDHVKAAERTIEEIAQKRTPPWSFYSEDYNRQGEDQSKAAKKMVEKMLARAKLPVPNETPTSSTQHQNATSPESVPPQALKTDDQHLPEDTESGFQRSKLDKERTEKAIEWLKGMLRKAGKLVGAPRSSQQWSIAQSFEPPQKIEPLVFSCTEKTWVKSQREMSLDFNQRKLKFGDVLPVVQWNLRMFGPNQYIPARSKAAMDLLERIFGWKSTPMAVALHEVNPQTLQIIMSHPWVQREFLVGVDDDSNIFDDKFSAEVGLNDLPSVLLVSANLCTDNWISRRLGQFHRVLSVDLPFQGEHEQQDRRDLLRLCAARLERVVLGNRWTAYDQHREDERKKKMENDINDFMTTGHSPGDKVVSIVMARDLTFRHLDGSRSRQYRHKYRWWNFGAMRTRDARVVDFWAKGTSTAFVDNMEIDKLTTPGGQFQYGINCKTNLGHISQAGPTMDHSPALLLSDYGLQFKVRSWREVADNDMLGWPRNVARVQRSKYWPYGPGSRLPAFQRQEESLADLPRPPVLANIPIKGVSQEATDTVEKELPITNIEPKPDASASIPPSISNQEATEIMEKGLPTPSTEPQVSKELKVDASAARPPAFTVSSCNPAVNYDLTEFSEVMMWAGDDYGIARNIKVVEKKRGWLMGRDARQRNHRRKRTLLPSEDGSRWFND